MRYNKVMKQLSLPRRAALPFICGGGIYIIAAGLASAFLAHTPSYLAMWACAYLVLVGGVTQLGIGLAQWRLAVLPSRRYIWWVFGLFNLGNFAVLGGTLYSTNLTGQILVDVGSLSLALAMLLCLLPARKLTRSWWSVAYVVLIGIILVSIPIGVALSLR